MDNAAFHSKAYLLVIAEAYRHKILWLPEYSPGLNPIEHAWGNMKKRLRNYYKKYSNIRMAISDYFR